MKNVFFLILVIIIATLQACKTKPEPRQQPVEEASANREIACTSEVNMKIVPPPSPVPPPNHP